jgi:hypothetical protein
MRYRYTSADLSRFSRYLERYLDEAELTIDVGEEMGPLIDEQTVLKQ